MPPVWFLYHTPTIPKYLSFWRFQQVTTYGTKWVNLHSKICLHTHPYVVVHLKSEKDKYLGTNGVHIRLDMEIYLQHGPQRKCAGLVSVGCSQRDDLSLNSDFNFRFLYWDFYICAPGSLALLIHPHSVNFCSLFPTPLPETLRTGYNGCCRRVNAFDH